MPLSGPGPNSNLDPIARVIRELRADTGVAGIVGAKVWGEELPGKVSADPRDYILVHGLGTVLMKRAPVQIVRVSVQCVSKNHRLASVLYRAVSAALHMKGPRHDSGGIGIYLSEEEIGDQPLTDPQTGWPYRQSIYQAFATTGVVA